MIDLRILPEVFQDTAAAADWDDEKEFGIGDRFLSSFRSTDNPIRIKPHSFTIIYKNYRRVLLEPFPYAVYFRLHDEHAIIALVLRTARNPATLRRKLRSREKL